MNRGSGSPYDVASYQALVIGVSSGGLKALTQILPKLPAGYPLAVIIVQHRGEVVFEPGGKSDFLVSYFRRICKMAVKEAVLGEPVKMGTIYIAPVKYHLLIEKTQHFSLSLEPPVNFSIPSIDVLFETASACYKNQLIGLILTGANSDGSLGLKEIHRNGGLTLVQEPTTAEIDVMPKAAINSHEVDYILPLDDIASFMCQVAQMK